MQQILFSGGRLLFNVQQHYTPDNKVWKSLSLIYFFYGDYIAYISVWLIFCIVSRDNSWVI